MTRARRTDAELGPSLTWPQSRAASAGIRARLRERRLTQAALARSAGMQQQAVSHLLSGALRWRERDAENAAAFLGTDLAGLLGGGAP